MKKKAIKTVQTVGFFACEMHGLTIASENFFCRFCGKQVEFYRLTPLNR